MTGFWYAIAALAIAATYLGAVQHLVTKGRARTGASSRERIITWLTRHLRFVRQMRRPTEPPPTPMTGDLPPDDSSKDDPAPSLEPLEAELARVELAYATRSEGVDTKAGVIVGAAGVLVTIGATGSPSIATVIGLFIAAAGGGFAVWAFSPRTGFEVSPQRMIDRGYLRTDDIRTRTVLLITRAGYQLADEGELIVKAARLKAAFSCLFLAVTVILVGLIIKVSTPGDTDEPAPAPPSRTAPGRSAPSVGPSSYPGHPAGHGHHDQPGRRQPGSGPSEAHS